MPIHGSTSSTYISCILYVRTRFPITWCILYVVAFSRGLPGKSGLVLIPYYCSVKILLNSWLNNSPPWSYLISTGHGYRTSRVVYTKFSITIAFLSLYSVISNHPVTGSIILEVFKIKGSLPFLSILYRSMRSTYILFQGIYSDSLSGNWPFVLLTVFVRWHTTHYVTSFWTVFLMSFHNTCCKIIASFLSHPGWRRYVWYHFKTYRWSCCGITFYFYAL